VRAFNASSLARFIECHIVISTGPLAEASAFTGHLAACAPAEPAPRGTTPRASAAATALSTTVRLADRRVRVMTTLLGEVSP